MIDINNLIMDKRKICCVGENIFISPIKTKVNIQIK